MRRTAERKRLTVKTLLAIISVGIFVYAGYYSLYFDSDGYFLAATGKYIVENGIPKYNPFTIAEIPFVCQQWLWCIWIYLTDLFGTAGHFFASAGMYIVLAVIIYRLFRKKAGRTASLFLTAVITFPCLYYLSGVRPQSITLILLFTQIIVTERYFKTREKRWLILLPVVTLIEANVHISMCVMHLLILLPYCVPLPNSPNQRVFKKSEIHVAVIVFLSMIAAMFINPYGADGVMYLFQSFTSDTFSIVSVMEMQRTKILSTRGIAVVVQIVLFVFLFKKRVMSNVTIYLSAGLIFLEALYSRNIMFTPIVGWALCSDMLDAYRKEIKRITEAPLSDEKIVIPFITTFLSLFAYLAMSMFGPSQISDLAAAVDWLDENVQNDVHIYTGFNTGAYLEYRGYTNLFMDARPEIYNVTDPESGLSYLEERHIFCTGTDSHAGKLYTFEELEEIMGPFEFKYFMIQISNDTFLGAYLASDDRYETVYSTDSIVLFERREE